MSFLKELETHLDSIMLPATTNMIRESMKTHESIKFLTVAAARDKVGKALYDLKRRNSVMSYNDDNGILWWNRKVEAKTEPKIEVKPEPVKVPEHFHKKSERMVLKTLMLDLAKAFAKASGEL